MLRMLFLALLLILPSCQKERGKQAPSAEAVAPAERGDVVATLQLPAGDSIKALAPLVDKMQPGGAGMLGGQIPILLAKACGVDLSAADLSRSVSLVVLNPKKFAEPFAVLARIENRAKLAADVKAAGQTILMRKDLALIGSSEAVESAKDYAFGSLASPADRIVAIAYPGPLNVIYKQEIDEAISEMSSAMKSLGSQGDGIMMLMESYRQALVAVAQQSDRVELSVDSTGKTPNLLFKVFPNAGTTLAHLVDAQVPAEHELLAKLPASSEGGIVFSGAMRAGKARQAIIDFSVEVMRAMYKGAWTKDIADQMAPWFNSFDGKVAMTMKMNLEEGGSPTMNYLLGSTDTQAMRKGWHSMFGALSKASSEPGGLTALGMKSSVQVQKNAFQVGAVEVDHYHSEFTMENMPAEQQAAMDKMGATRQDMYFATFDKFAALTSAADGKGSITAMVASARGEAAGFKVPAKLSAALKESRARKESLLAFMDLGVLVPKAARAQVPLESIVFGFGRDAEALVLRISVGL